VCFKVGTALGAPIGVTEGDVVEEIRDEKD